MCLNPKFYLPLALSVSLFLFGACNKEYFDFSKMSADSITPTIAVPIADLDITIEQIVQRYGSLADKIYDPNYSSGSDSVFFLLVEYSDTIAQIEGPLSPIAAGIEMPALDIPVDSIKMKIFGDLGGADALFRLTDPSIKFSFYNSIDKAFNLTFDTLYTKNIVTHVAYPFRVKPEAYPFTIAKPDAASAIAFSQIVLNNQNTESYDGSSNPMSNVIEPTPKYVFQSGKLIPIGTEATAAGGKITVVGRVLLPFQGFAKLNYRDTVPFQSIDTAGADLVDEVLLRMIFTNGIPLDAEINAYILDTVSGNTVYDFKFYDENGNEKTNGQFIEGAEVQGANQDYRPASPKVFYSDIKLTAAEFKQAMRGNALIIDAHLFTQDFDFQTANHANSGIVKIYTDFGMRVQLGLKTKLNINPTN